MESVFNIVNTNINNRMEDMGCTLPPAHVCFEGILQIACCPKREFRIIFISNYTTFSITHFTHQINKLIVIAYIFRFLPNEAPRGVRTTTKNLANFLEQILRPQLLSTLKNFPHQTPLRSVIMSNLDSVFLLLQVRILRGPLSPRPLLHPPKLPLSRQKRRTLRNQLLLMTRQLQTKRAIQPGVSIPSLKCLQLIR